MASRGVRRLLRTSSILLSQANRLGVAPAAEELITRTAPFSEAATGHCQPTAKHHHGAKSVLWTRPADFRFRCHSTSTGGGGDGLIGSHEGENSDGSNRTGDLLEGNADDEEDEYDDDEEGDYDEEEEDEEEVEAAGPPLMSNPEIAKWLEKATEEELAEVVSDEFFDQLGIPEEDIESALLMRDVRGVEGLPPLEELLAMDGEEEEKEKRRALEQERQQQIALQRVRKVDAQGRAYGTGRRKESSARVWVKEGKGRVVVNGREYDDYFKQLSHRAMLLGPFLATGSLGLFDVRATVKGGGITGQAGAIKHGISRALQSFDPSLHSDLRNAGLLTRDSRVVERKKPGKAKARKSFQWVKR